MTYLLRTFSDPVLHSPCDDVRPGDDLSYLRDMRKVCDKYNGVGLAAPQIGVSKRAVFLWPGRAGWGEYMLNPTVVEASEETETGEEGCLSFPGVHVPVVRHVWVKVTFQTKDFAPGCKLLRGFDAVIAQHEIDHTYGICRVGDAWQAKVRSETVQT